MSRSYRKPYSAITGYSSAKPDKIQAHRGVRAAQKHSLRVCIDWDEFLIPHIYECSHNDVWGWGRDGKQSLQKLDHQYFNPYYLHGKCSRELTSDELIEDCLKNIERQQRWVDRCSRK